MVLAILWNKYEHDKIKKWQRYDTINRHTSFNDREAGIQKAFMDIEEPIIVMTLGKENETTQKVNGTTVLYDGGKEVLKASG